MPTYEYEGPGCGHRFDKFQNMSDAPVKKCPECAK
ncbi:MAG: FmdB family zinc ribbon protein [Kiritimatiellia bacterium]|nr:zinc ribbon domain-containing protein [Lentisphaerota bacterium]